MPIYTQKIITCSCRECTSQESKLRQMVLQVSGFDPIHTTCAGSCESLFLLMSGALFMLYLFKERTLGFCSQTGGYSLPPCLLLYFFKRNPLVFACIERLYVAERLRGKKKKKATLRKVGIHSLLCCHMEVSKLGEPRTLVYSLFLFNFFFHLFFINFVCVMWNKWMIMSYACTIRLSLYFNATKG